MRPLLLCICMVASLVPVSAFDQFGPRPPERCEALRQDSCRQFYNNTVVPNKFDHYTQAEAATEMSHYPVQSMNCSDELLFLLCALYFPICTDYSHLLSLPPCRSVCLRVRRRCEPYLVERGYPWPDRLNCERLPERDEANGVVCMSDNRTESSWTPIPTSVPEMGGTSSHEGGGTDEESTRPSTLQECRSPLIPSGSKSDSFAGLSYCRAPCNTFYDEEQLRFASDWILAWSCISLTAVIASLLYFYLNKDRFYDIERPILYLTCCYVPVAVAYIIGFGADKTSIACYEGQGTEGTHLNETAQRIEEWKNAPCVITFLLSSYFETAAHTWWVVLTLYLFTAAGIGWDVARISHLFRYFHALAWSVPAIQVVIVLALQAVDGDPLSNICSPGNSNLVFFTGFVVAQLIVFLILGAVFLVCGLVAAKRQSSNPRIDEVRLQHIDRLSSSSQRRLVRSSLGNDNRTESRTGSRTESMTESMPESMAACKEGEFPIAASLLGLFYLIIVTLLLACVLYEQQSRATWEKDFANCVVNNLGCESRSRPPATIYLLKYLMTLAGAVVIALWAWAGKLRSSKTCKMCHFDWTPKECVRNCQQPGSPGGPITTVV